MRRPSLSEVTWSILESAYPIYVGASMSVLSRIDFGINVFDREWDVLVVLDTCRVDSMRRVAPAFEFVDDVGSIWSLGSTSSEWIAKTFTTDHIDTIHDTALVSANPHVQHTLYDRQFPEHDKGAPFALTDWDTVDPADFLYVEQPWTYATDERYSHVMPSVMTERAVDVYRTHRPDRLVVHYMPPHRPHVSAAVREDRDLTDVERDPFGALRTGETTAEAVRENHVADLRFVLEEGVEPLLENIDADTVAITADHGDGFGDWGCFAHVAGDPRPPVRKVPWVTTSAEDIGNIEPETVPPEEQTDGVETQSQLEALGYV